MKKIIKSFLIFTTSALLLTACSSKKSLESNAEGKSTRIVTTVMGDIEVPENPERVVANWYVGDVITLGLNLEGYNAWNQETMPFHEELNKSNKLENWESEDILALNPDLIITYSQEDFEKFSKIAPVLVVPEGDISSVDRIEILGRATGREKEANEAIEKFNRKLEESKELLRAEKFKNKTFSIMEDWGPSGEWSGVAFETGSRGGTLVYKYLGLEYPKKLEELIDKTGETRGTISYEVAHEYFGDYILWFQQEGKESEYAKTDIWKSIDAVKNNRLVEIPGENLGLFFYSDIMSLTSQLDFMIDALNSIGE